MQELSSTAIEALRADAKVAVVATLDARGRPHSTLLTSLEAQGPGQLTFGQFSNGASKDNLRRDPRAAFLVMTMDRRIWRGRARWTRSAGSGAEFDHYNHKPMFRYNAYFGIHTVHYLDLVEAGEQESVSPAAFLGGQAVAAVMAPWCHMPSRSAQAALGPWTRALLDSLRTLKFLTYVDDEGWPRLVPMVPCRSAGSRRVVLTPGGHAAELTRLGAHRLLTLHALNLDMESVVLRGRFSGWQRRAGMRYGTLDVDWVYNSMPPNHGVIYPARDPQPVSFEPAMAAPAQGVRLAVG
jgi:hypothetical protein